MTANPYGKKMPETPIDKTSGEVPDSKVAKGKKNPRQMTAKRKISYLLLKPIILIIVNFIWLTCRIKVIHLFCAWYMLKQIKCGMNVGFLVSPSVDGEIPAQIASSRGAKVIRGSSTRTGAQALRDMYQIIVKDGVSPVTTSDGPTGPIFKFKPGAAMLSQMTKAPMVPIACAAKNAWYLGSWDRFMVPKPFTKIVVAVGEPISVDKAEKDLSPVQEKMEYAINDLMKNAKQAM